MPSRWSGRDTHTLSAVAMSALLPARSAAGCVTAMFTMFIAGHLGPGHQAYGSDGTPGESRSHAPRLPLQAPFIAWAWSLTKPVTRKPVRP
ncbi:MAG: hypothetical protein ABWX69_09940 [Arthrobacter sp.]